MRKILIVLLFMLCIKSFSNNTVLKYKINSEPLYLSDNIIQYEILYLNIKNNVKYEFKHNDIDKIKIVTDTLNINIDFIPCINDTIEINQ